MSRDDMVHAAWGLTHMGGFGRALAALIYVADSHNLKIIAEAWPELIARGLSAYNRGLTT